MLRGIHKASANWLGRAVMGVVLALIAISFGIWGIGDIFRGFGQSTVARIGNTDIRVDGFRQTYQDRLQEIARRTGRPILPDQARALGLDRQVLAQVIAETVLDARTKSLRLGLTEAEIARRTTEDTNFQGLGGQFDRTRFEYAIRSLGYTEARYLAEQRRTALRRQLVGTVSGDIGAPKASLEALNHFRNEQRTLEYALLDRAQAGAVPAPAADVLTKYFEERKVLFRSPEYRRVQLISLTPAEIAPTIEVSDDDVRKAYDDRRSRYQTPERRHIQQIPFPSMDEARAAADKIAKGMSFIQLAAERSLKESDIDLGIMAKTAMVDRAIGDAAFALEVGKVSAPVEGRFGAALVRVIGLEPAVTRTLKEVAAELKKDLATARAKNLLAGIHDKVEDERLSGTALPDIAKKLNLKLVTIDAVSRAGLAPDGSPIPGLPQGIDVLRAVFAADLGGDNDPLSIPSGGGYIWFDVTDITPARDQPLDEIKDKVVARWRDDEIASRLKVKSAEFLDKIKGGAQLKDVAAAAKLKVETATGVKRDSPPAAIPARALEPIFGVSKGEAGVVDAANGIDRILYRVTDITVPRFDPASDDAKRLDEAMRRALSEEILQQYIARLENEIGVTINQRALNQVTGSTN